MMTLIEIAVAFVLAKIIRNHNLTRLGPSRRSARCAALALLTLAAGCGGDNPAGPGGPGDDDGGGGPAPLHFTSFQAAAFVIGQPDMTARTSNAGGTGPNAIGMVQPCGAGGGSFYVPDPLNHRILGFSGMPSSNGPAAGFVLGQPDFTSKSSGLGAQKFNEPTHCGVGDGRFFVVDTVNHRVLIWSSPPTGDVPADVVVGQPDFSSVAAGPTASILDSVRGAAIGGGKLAVCDPGAHRVLIWNTIPTENGAPADVVLGQSDFTSAVPGLTASALNIPVAVWTDGTRLVVADGGNERVLIWSTFPAASGAPADVVVGAPDFVSPGTGAPSATSIGWPAGVASDGASLFVADGMFSRVLVYTPFPTSNGAAATAVLGQNSLVTWAHNDANQDGTPDSPNARTLATPHDVSVVGDHLLVADNGNNRILAFDGR
jgi:hypothetical protein